MNKALFFPVLGRIWKRIFLKDERLLGNGLTFREIRFGWYVEYAIPHIPGKDAYRIIEKLFQYFRECDLHPYRKSRSGVIEFSDCPACAAFPPHCSVERERDGQYEVTLRIPPLDHATNLSKWHGVASGIAKLLK